MSASAGGVLTFAWALLLPVSQASEPNVRTTHQTIAEVATEATTPSPQPDDAVYGTLKLEPLQVSVPSFKIPRTRPETLKLKLYLDLKLDFGWPFLGANYLVTAARVPQRLRNIAQTARVLVPAEPNHGGTLFSTAELVPSDRSSSFSGGSLDLEIRLRGLGALVLLDGAPVNDPFGGWIPLAKLPREALARVELVPGGGATAWGNGTIGGAVQFFTLPPKGKMVLENFDPADGGPPDPKLTKQVIYGTIQLAATAGNLGTQGVEFVTSQPTSHGVLQVLGRGFQTDGYSLVGTGQGGPIDLPAWNRHHWLEARWRQPLGKDVELLATICEYDESGGNGTAYQQDSSRGTFASVAAAGNPRLGFVWNALAYVQWGSSGSRFSAVNAARTAETPVIDRFAVPTTAFGGSWTAAWRHFGDARTNAGADLRYTRGETRENVDFTNGTFTRQLLAGGTQGTIGVFISHDHTITKVLRATAGARIDAWNEADGHQREINRGTNAVVFEKNYGTDTGAEFSPSLGIVWQPNKTWRWRANGQHAFRRPTLGEHYQSSGRYNVVTAANSELQTEHSTNVEIAAEYSFYQKTSSPLFTIEVRAFLNELHDAISAVTVARGSGEFPLLDTLPASYRGVKRANLDRARLQGLELAAMWQPSPRFALEATVLWNNATILRSTVSPGLDGKRMVEVPRNTTVLSATWRASEDIAARLRVRSVGRQFIDNENTLSLSATAVADLGVSYLVNKHTELYLTAENLTDSRTETGRDTSGLVYIGSPRIVLCGVRLTW